MVVEDGGDSTSFLSLSTFERDIDKHGNTLGGEYRCIPIDTGFVEDSISSIYT